MKFTQDIRIAFDECDPAGILFYGRVYAYAHRCIEEFVEHVGIGWSNWFDHPDWGVPIVHSEADYKNFLNAGKAYRIELNIERVGGSSVAFQYIFLNGEDICAQVKTVHAFVDMSHRKIRPMPKEIRDKLKVYKDCQSQAEPV